MIGYKIVQRKNGIWTGPFHHPNGNDVSDHRVRRGYSVGRTYYAKSSNGCFYPRERTDNCLPGIHLYKELDSAKIAARSGDRILLVGYRLKDIIGTGAAKSNRVRVKKIRVLEIIQKGRG